MTTGMTRDQLEGVLGPRLPGGTVQHVLDLMSGRPLVVRLVPPRRTKLGDYRPPSSRFVRWWSPVDSVSTAAVGDDPSWCHRITLNDDLNPFSLLTTLLHEIAHLVSHERRMSSGRRRRQRPHGPEWKEAFGGILGPVVERGGLPRDVTDALSRMLEDPPAASCTDRRLTAVLRRYDPPQPGVETLESLPEGACFRLTCGRMFRRGRRLRTTFLCVELSRGRIYRVRSDSLVQRIDGIQPGPGSIVHSRRSSARRRATACGG
ncbi:MAG: hypothetical protein ACKOCN_13745 [Planctomycetaceae bacterium]